MRIEPRARDRKEADNCEQWYESGPGAFAMKMQQGLLKKMISTWPRRNQSLLEIDCGPAPFLDTFYTAGFDVSGIESSPELLAKARAKTGSYVDLHLGRAEHLPFEDSEFDFSAIICGLDFSPQPGRAILEAARVAKKGMLIGFLNKYSLAYPLRRIFSSSKLYPFYRARWFSPWSLQSLIVESTGYRSISIRGLLPGPICTWRSSCPWRQINNLPIPWFAGAFCLAKIDFLDEPPLTPLMAFTVQKNFNQNQEEAGCLNITDLHKDIEITTPKQ